MANEVIQRMQSHLDALAQGIPGENIEFWYARDLQEPLGYARWENFMTAIRRAMGSCESTGYSVDDHFRGVTKMVEIGKGGQRGIRPEHLPAEEDIKKLERRVKCDEKKLEKRSGKLPGKKAD